jgi:type II secretory pathway pseudopilin PulG
MRSEKGVTLIALVITIALLLILSGVVIYNTMGDHGILSKAQEATESFGDAKANEELVMQSYISEFNRVDE